MSKKKIQYLNSKDSILKAANLMADVVCETMGPGGRNVILENSTYLPIITKDGVTVANSMLDLEDAELNLVARIIKEAADRTNKEAGDGTTTSIALTRAILQEGYKYIVGREDVTRLKRELTTGLQKVLVKLKDLARVINREDPYAELYSTALISLNGDKEMAELVAKAITSVGLYGVVNVADGNGLHHETQKVEGIKMPVGWVSPFFCKNREDKKIIFEDCSVLITSHLLKNVAQLTLIEEALKPLIKSGKPLLIISSECSGSFLSNMVANNKQGQLTNCAIRAPYFGTVRKEFYTDLAIVTGATVFEAEQGHDLAKIKFEHLGHARRVEITDMSTTIIGGGGDIHKINARIEQLKNEAKDVDPENDLDKIRERLAQLDSGVILIKLAKASSVESIELKHRIEDSINACKAALEEGLVPGGGAALFYASLSLDQSIPGEKVLLNACRAPLMKIHENAGFSGKVAIHVLNAFKTCQTMDVVQNKVVDPFESGIVDPHKVTRSALINAVSIASTLLTTNAIISTIPEAAHYNPYEMNF